MQFTFLLIHLMNKHIFGGYVLFHAWLSTFEEAMPGSGGPGVRPGHVFIIRKGRGHGENPRLWLTAGLLSIRQDKPTKQRDFWMNKLTEMIHWTKTYPKKTEQELTRKRTRCLLGFVTVGGDYPDTPAFPEVASGRVGGATSQRRAGIGM